MKNRMRILVLLGVLIIGLFAGLNISRADDVDIKKMMGTNFDHIQKILVDLIEGDYSAVPHDVQVIEEHAIQLATSIPKSAKNNEKQFLVLAFNLQVHANNLQLITKTMQEGKKTSKKMIGLDIDYLRNSAAAHFGQLITTCVACHNLFRGPLKKK